MIPQINNLTRQITGFVYKNNAKSILKAFKKYGVVIVQDFPTYPETEIVNKIN